MLLIGMEIDLKNIVSMRLDNILSKSVFHISGSTLDENIRNTVTFIKIKTK